MNSNQKPFKVRESLKNPIQYLSASLELSNQPAGNYYFNEENNYNYTRNSFNYNRFHIIGNETVINEVVQGSDPDLITNTLDMTKTYQLPATNLTPDWMARIESGYTGFSGTDNNGNTYVMANYDGLNNLDIYNSNNNLFESQPDNGNGSTSICLTKYDSSGNAIWSARIYTETPGEKILGDYCVTDKHGTTYMLISDRGAGNVIFENASGSIEYNLNASDKTFLVAYNSNGVPNWITYTTPVQYKGLLYVDNQEIGNVYMLGGETFYDGVPLNPTPVLQIPVNNVLVIAKYRSSSGLFQWATYIQGRATISRDYQDFCNQSLSVDSFGNVYLTGYYIEILPLVNAATPTNPVFTNSGVTVPPYSSPVIWTPYETNRNWSAIDLSLNGEVIVVTVAGGFIYICYNRDYNVWVPRASIQNWSSVYCNDTGDLIIATVYDSVIYRSIDFGETWTITGGEGSNARRWVAIAGSLNGNRLVAIVKDDQIYYSIDFGSTWNVSSSIIANWIDVAYDVSTNIFIALVKNGQAYFSMDKGRTWTLDSSSPIANWSAITGSRVSAFPSFNFFATVEDGNIYGIDVSTTNEIPTMSDDTTPVGYIASASSSLTLPPIVTIYPYYAFDNKNDTYWESNVQDFINHIYDSTTGLYIGTVTTIVDGNPINGEWIQIQLPSSIILNNFSITSFDTLYPKDFIIAGSNDGTTWTQVCSFSGQTYSGFEVFVIPSPILIAFTYFRLITTKVGGGDNRIAVTIIEWNLNLNSTFDWVQLQNVDRNWSDIAMGSGAGDLGNLFATVMDGAIYQSTYTTEETWTPVTIPRNWNRVAMSNGDLAVATVQGGQIYISTNFFPKRHSFLFKYNSQGVVQWTNYVNCPESFDNVGTSITTNQNGEIILHGSLGKDTQFFSPNDFQVPIKTVTQEGGRYLACYSPDGLPLWVNRMILEDYSTFAQFKSIAVDSHNNIYCFGYAISVTFENPTGLIVYGPDIFSNTYAIIAKFYPDGSFQSFARVGSPTSLTYGNSIQIVDQDIYLSGWNYRSFILGSSSRAPPPEENIVTAYSSDSSVTVSNDFNTSGIFVCRYVQDSSQPFELTPHSYNSTFETRLTIGGSVRKLINEYISDGPVEVWGGQTGFTPKWIALEDANTGVVAHLGHQVGYTNSTRSPEYNYLTVNISEPSFPLNDPQPVTPGTIPYGFLPIFISFPEYTHSVSFNNSTVVYPSENIETMRNNAVLYALGDHIPESGLRISGISPGDRIRLLIEPELNQTQYATQYITLTVKECTPSDAIEQIPAAIVFEEPASYLQAIVGNVESTSTLIFLGSQRYVAAFFQPTLIRSGTLYVGLETIPKQVG
jgi:hypothetical protein